MSATKAGLLILFGCIFVVAAIVNRRFYWIKGWFGGDNEAPQWVGKLAFGLAGLVMIVVGTRDLWVGK